jgi:hypothetical protein
MTDKVTIVAFKIFEFGSRRNDNFGALGRMPFLKNRYLATAVIYKKPDWGIRP